MGPGSSIVRHTEDAELQFHQNINTLGSYPVGDGSSKRKQLHDCAN